MNRNITATILIVLGIGIYFTVTKGMLDDAKSVKAVNDQYAAAIDSADKLIQVRDQVLKNYRAISADDQDRLNRMIPNSVDNIRLIIDLNSVALRHNFSLKNIKATADNASTQGNSAVPALAPQVGGGAAAGNASNLGNPTLDTVTVSFSVTAPYLEFLSFMQDLEANLRVMDMTHLTVAANDNGVYDFGVELRTYWLRQ